MEKQKKKNKKNNYLMFLQVCSKLPQYKTSVLKICMEMKKSEGRFVFFLNDGYSVVCYFIFWTAHRIQ